MAAWSHNSNRLYYRDAAGVHSWDPPSTVTTMLPGLAWFSPSASPDDRYVAYTVNLDVEPHVVIRDLVSNKVTFLPGIRTAQFFVSSRLLMVGVYEPSNQQGLGTQPYTQTSSAEFDLNTSVETPLHFAFNLIDTWPR
jgi:hypothetical protein